MYALVSSLNRLALNERWKCYLYKVKKLIPSNKTGDKLYNDPSTSGLPSVWPDWAIYCTFGNFLKPLATINLFKSPCKGVKIDHFYTEIIFRLLL